jgi:hypothetical protein
MIRGSKFAMKSGSPFDSIYGKPLQLAAEHICNFASNLSCRTMKQNMSPDYVNLDEEPRNLKT